MLTLLFEMLCVFLLMACVRDVKFVPELAPDCIALEFVLMLFTFLLMLTLFNEIEKVLTLMLTLFIQIELMFY